MQDGLAVGQPWRCGSFIHRKCSRERRRNGVPEPRERAIRRPAEASRLTLS
jgi:hypothetical protein